MDALVRDERLPLENSATAYIYMYTRTETINVLPGSRVCFGIVHTWSEPSFEKQTL